MTDIISHHDLKPSNRKDFGGRGQRQMESEMKSFMSEIMGKWWGPGCGRASRGQSCGSAPKYLGDKGGYLCGTTVPVKSRRCRVRTGDDGSAKYWKAESTKLKQQFEAPRAQWRTNISYSVTASLHLHRRWKVRLLIKHSLCFH